MARKRNFWQCDTKAALRGCEELTAEETGVYFVLLNLMYEDWEPLRWHNDATQRAVLNRFNNDSKQKVRAVIARLLAKGRILCVDIDGRAHLIDERFAEECEGFTGMPNPLKTPSRPVDKPVDSEGEGEAESGHSSGKGPAKVSDSPEFLGDYGPSSSMNSKAVETIREENNKKIKEKKKKRKAAGGGGNLTARWLGNPALRQAVVEHHGEGFARSYLDTAKPYLGGVRTRTRQAYDVLSSSIAMQGVLIVPP